MDEEDEAEDREDRWPISWTLSGLGCLIPVLWLILWIFGTSLWSVLHAMYVNDPTYGSERETER